MKPPTQCALRRDPEATLARPLKQQFALLCSFLEESHWWRHLLQCRACGQRSVCECHEEVDRADGDDPQSVTLVPAETRAGIDAVCAAPQGCLGGVVPRLGKDRPKGAARHRVRRVT
jgi:hypothetical protein